MVAGIDLSNVSTQNAIIGGIALILSVIIPAVLLNRAQKRRWGVPSDGDRNLMQTVEDTNSRVSSVQDTVHQVGSRVDVIREEVDHQRVVGNGRHKENQRAHEMILTEQDRVAEALKVVNGDIRATNTQEHMKIFEEQERMAKELTKRFSGREEDGD